MKIVQSGLPIYINQETGKLQFKDGLTCEGSGGKAAGEMTGLFRDPEHINEQDYMYTAYRNIIFPEHVNLFAKYDFRYDITAIEPGTINGEFKKTSGHYHGYIEGGNYPYAEVYEVIKGEIIFILQKVLNFDKDEEPKLEEVRVVHVKAGQAIIVPPFCGHCSINPTDEISMFSNIAVISCPLDYEKIKKKHGLSVYVLKDGDSFKVEKNERYQNVPEPKIVTPVENKELGIEFCVPCYTNFVAFPGKYDFLLHPDHYADSIYNMTK